MFFSLSYIIYCYYLTNSVDSGCKGKYLFQIHQENLKKILFIPLIRIYCVLLHANINKTKL